MQIQLDGALAFVSVQVAYRGRLVTIDRILIDSGSESTILAVDAVEPVGIQLERGDRIETIRGVGGREYVFSRVIDRLSVGSMVVPNFQAEFGGMDYGFAIQGVLGMDFLVPTRAILDFGSMEIKFPDQPA